MDLKSTIQSDLKDAMRQGDETRKSTLRMALAAIKLAEVEKRSQVDKASQVDDTLYLAIIQKEIKSRRESIADAEKAHRPELIAQAEREIKVLEGYLPPAFTPEELEALVKAAISEVGATSIREMGQVMKLIVPRLQGRASNDQASQVVRKLLQ